MSDTPESVREYLSRIGRKGGTRSRRVLTSDEARQMVRVREARRAFHKFHAQCFWYMRDDMPITAADIAQIAQGLRQNGGRQGYLLAAKLCR